MEIDWRMRVFDSLSFPTLILRPNRIIVSVNQKMLEKLQVSKSDVVGKTCRDVFHTYFNDPDLPCTHDTCPLDKTLRDGVGNSILRQIRLDDGSSYWEDRVFSPILDDTGRAIYVIESIRDVTRTKTLEKIFHDIREFMDRVVQSSASGILAADRSGKILLMNQAAEELFGYPFTATQNMTVADIYPEGVAKEVMKKLRDEAYGGKGKLPVTRVNILTARGEKIPVEMTGAIIYEDDREAATMGIYNDLRERLAVGKKLEEAQTQLIQSEKMASLGRLAAGVAHEINNPLTGILMYGSLIQEKLAPDHPLLPSLGFILEDAERCRDIVKNLLAYSRQSSTTRNSFSLNTLVEESLRLIRDQKLFMTVTISRNLSSDWMLVYADQNKLSQVVINLIINAIDAMNRQGVLTLTTYRNDETGMACLEVSDTGCGIPKENLSRVFDPFFTTKEMGKGTGLGLSTAYGIAKDNAGDISIKQTGPNGTTFLLEIPLDHESMEMMSESIG